MLTALEILAAYTAVEDRIDTEVSTCRRDALRSPSPGNSGQREHRRQERVEEEGETGTLTLLGTRWDRELANEKARRSPPSP